MSLGSETNSRRLSFDSANDALDYARQTVEDSNRWLAFHSINLPNRYERVNLDVDTTWYSARDAHQ